MIFQSIEQLTKNTYNRYELVIATAKAARIITDDLNEKKEEMEKNAIMKEPIAPDKLPQTAQTPPQVAQLPQIPREIRDIPDEKPVKSAIQKIFEGDYIIVVD